MIETPRSIVALRRQVNKGMLAVIWLHLPLLVVVAVLLDHGWLGTELTAIGLATAATLCWQFSPDRLETRLTVGVAQVGMVALIVDQLSGNAWQVDAHMYFFVALAILTAYCDWRVLLLAAGATALHHLVLNFLLPAAVYPGGADLGRVVLHAVILVLETGALVWLAHQITTLLDVSRTALHTASAARAAEAKSHALAVALQAEIETAKQQTHDILAQQFEADVGALVRNVAVAVADVHRISAGLFGTVLESAGSTARILDASRGTSLSVQTVAAATEELSASVLGISAQIARAASIAHQAVEQTNQTTSTIKRLADLAARIETVVQLINGVAGQTNLLALNATIEAARAGNAGKGFAVVANEVKILATQTAKATEEIRSQIAAIQTGTDHAVGAIAGITQTIADLGAITTTVAAAVEQQGAATAKIARSAQQAAAGTETISRNLAALAQASNDTGAAAEAGRTASGQLSDHCGRMTDSMRNFVGSLRTA